jgi:16S rRNA (uracil1498-N3)-methyltransferase
MHHFFVEASAISNGTVELTGDEAHHAAHVVRVRKGETISVADGTGKVVEAVVTRVGRDVEAEIRGVREVVRPHPLITLCQGIAKGDRMDVAVEKAVEIGVAAIVPFLAERSIVRWEPRRREKAVERWSAIARSAAKQSRSAFVTSVEPVHEGVTGLGGRNTLALHEKATVRMRDALPQPVPDALMLVVGPEGGLSDDEVSALAGEGAAVVSLGPRILRTETAGLVAATIVLHGYGSLG